MDLVKEFGEAALKIISSSSIHTDGCIEFHWQEKGYVPGVGGFFVTTKFLILTAILRNLVLLIIILYLTHAFTTLFIS